MMLRLTSDVARGLDVPVTRIWSALRIGRMDPPPARDSSGRYVWAPDDIARLCVVLGMPRRRPGEVREVDG